LFDKSAEKAAGGEMNGLHSIFDHVLFALLLTVPLIEWRWSWPRFLRKLAAGVHGVRLRHYRNLVLGEWLPAICLLAVWAAQKRPWSNLWLTEPSPWRMAIGLVCSAAIAALLIAQRLAIQKRPQSHDKVRAALKYAEPLLPHTPAEHRLFWLVSVTAGVCEEIFYRGFLTWYLAVWVGLVPAVLLSAIIFGFGHIYLGLAHVPRTAIVGLVMSCVTIGSASVIPAMLLHAAIDWNSGEMGFRFLGAAEESAST
jgi:uncharacterized protein